MTDIKELRESLARVQEARRWSDAAWAQIEAQLFLAEHALRSIRDGAANPAAVAKGALADIEELIRDPA